MVIQKSKGAKNSRPKFSEDLLSVREPTRDAKAHCGSDMEVERYRVSGGAV